MLRKTGILVVDLLGNAKGAKHIPFSCEIEITIVSFHFPSGDMGWSIVPKPIYECEEDKIIFLNEMFIRANYLVQLEVSMGHGLSTYASNF